MEHNNGIGQDNYMIPNRCVIEDDLFSRVVMFTEKTRYLEMGGFGVGYLSEKGTTVSMVGAVFPPQIINTGSYCEFDCAHLVLVKNAIQIVNEKYPSTDLLKNIGWMHTHPSIGIFLSGTDKHSFSIWGAFDPSALAFVIDPFNKDDRVGAFNTKFERVKCEIGKIDLKEHKSTALQILREEIKEAYGQIETSHHPEVLLIHPD